jgi:hypothetical protein
LARNVRIAALDIDGVIAIAATAYATGAAAVKAVGAKNAAYGPSR